MEPTFTQSSSKILEYKQDGEIVKDNLETFEKQLALLLLQQDLEDTTREEEQESKNADEAPSNRVVKTSRKLSPSLLRNLHQNLIFAYSEVEVMHDVVSKLIDTMKKADIPQKLMVTAINPPSSSSTSTENDTNKAKDQSKCLLNKQKQYAKARDMLKLKKDKLSMVLDKEHDLFDNDVMTLREHGWVLNRWRGQFSVKYGPSDEYSVPVGQYDKIPDNHMKKRLICEWNVSGSDAVKPVIESLQVPIILPYNNKSAMDTSSDAEDEDFEIVLEEARRCVLDEALFFRLQADASRGLYRLAHVEETGSGLCIPLTANISISFRMVSSTAQMNALSQWTVAMARRFLVNQLKHAKGLDDYGLLPENMDQDSRKPILVSTVEYCQLLLTSVEVQLLIDEQVKRLPNGWTITRDGWSSTTANSKALRVCWLNKDGDGGGEEQVMVSAVRHLGSAVWQLTKMNENGEWHSSDYPGKTESLFNYILSCLI